MYTPRRSAEHMLSSAGTHLLPVARSRSCISSRRYSVRLFPEIANLCRIPPCGISCALEMSSYPVSHHGPHTVTHWEADGQAGLWIQASREVGVGGSSPRLALPPSCERRSCPCGGPMPCWPRRDRLPLLCAGVHAARPLGGALVQDVARDGATLESLV